MEKSKNTSVRATSAAPLSQWAWLSRSKMKNIYKKKTQRTKQNPRKMIEIRNSFSWVLSSSFFYASFLPSHRSGAFLCVRSVGACHSTPAKASAREGSVGKSHQSIMLLTLDILMHIIRHTCSHVFLRWWQDGIQGTYTVSEQRAALSSGPIAASGTTVSPHTITERALTRIARIHRAPAAFVCRVYLVLDNNICNK